MRIAVNLLIRSICIGTVGVYLLVLPARGDSEARWSEAPKTYTEGRWALGLSVASGVAVQQMTADVDSTIMSTMAPLRPSASGDDFVVNPYVGPQLELMTPGIDLPGSPRFFVSGAILPSFGSRFDVADEGDAGPLTPPNVGPTPPVTLSPCMNATRICYEQDAITGNGSLTSAKIAQMVYTAGIGVAFPFEFRGRAIRIKPMASWINYRVDAKGKVRAGLRPDPIPPPPSPTNDANEGPTRFVAMDGEKSKTFNAIGPGLEIEMDVNRWGPFQPALFFEVHGYHVLGDRNIDFNGSSTYTTNSGNTALTPETYTANWHLEVDRWIVRSGVGLRLRFVGFD